jgi:DNA-binding response OmpR family regulator
MELFPSPTNVPGEDARQTILVAEDEDDIAGYVRIGLENAGYEVLTADDGEEALQLALERKPDLAVLDVRMPMLDGFGVTRQIRRSEPVRDMPVILLTGMGLDEDIEMGRKAGANEYLMKPVALKDLLATVRSALGHR